MNRARWFSSMLLLGIAITLPRLGRPDHGAWLDHYRDAEHRPCCSMAQDCRVVHARLVSQNGTEVVVEINGVLVTLYAGSVHVSEDDEDWACIVPPWADVTSTTVRCVFIAVHA